MGSTLNFSPMKRMGKINYIIPQRNMITVCCFQPHGLKHVFFFFSLLPINMQSQYNKKAIKCKD